MKRLHGHLTALGFGEANACVVIVVLTKRLRRRHYLSPELEDHARNNNSNKNNDTV